MTNKKIKVICFDNLVHKKNQGCLNYKSIEIPTLNPSYEQTKKLIVEDYVVYSSSSLKIQGFHHHSNDTIPISTSMLNSLS